MHTFSARRFLEPVRRGMLVLAALVLALGVAGCATLPDHLPQGPIGHAPPPQPGGALADLENSLHAKLGIDGSAWRALDSNEDAFRWRLAMVDSAQHTLDLQYYFWWEDDTGQ